MKTKNKPIHPGVLLKKIKPEALNNTALAEKLNMCRTTLWRFMNGKRRLDPGWASALAEITDKSTREWIEAQATYDVWEEEMKFKNVGQSKKKISSVLSTNR
jgi:addiction module HigA family antidote